MLSHLKNYAYRSEVSPEHLVHMTDWLLQWRKRDPDLSFSIVLIDFKNPSDLGNALGAKYAMELIRRVGSEINSALRTTDMFSRAHVSSFWVLLPKGDPEIVLRKLEPILLAARRDGMDATQLNVRKIVIPTDIASDVTASEIFNQMQTSDH